MNKCPERHLSLGLIRIVVFEDCKASALTTQPPWLVRSSCYLRAYVSASFYFKGGLLRKYFWGALRRLALYKKNLG